MMEATSLFSGLLTPDFSAEEDLGEALYAHMMQVGVMLRAANLMAADDDANGAEEIGGLALDMLSMGCAEFERCNLDRAHKARQEREKPKGGASGPSSKKRAGKAA